MRQRFTEVVKCWRIDSIGHGWTRPVSSTVRLPESHQTKRTKGVYTSFSKRQSSIMVIVMERIVVNHTRGSQSQLRWP